MESGFHVSPGLASPSLLAPPLIGVLGLAPVARCGERMLLTSVSGLTRDRGVCRHGEPYWVFSRICYIEQTQINIMWLMLNSKGLNE